MHTLLLLSDCDKHLKCHKVGTFNVKKNCEYYHWLYIARISDGTEKRNWYGRRRWWPLSDVTLICFNIILVVCRVSFSNWVGPILLWSPYTRCLVIMNPVNYQISHFSTYKAITRVSPFAKKRKCVRYYNMGVYTRSASPTSAACCQLHKLCPCLRCVSQRIQIKRSTDSEVRRHELSKKVGNLYEDAGFFWQVI